MTDFKIRRGLASQLKDQRLVLEAGCWYLATDTAELFLCTVDTTGVLTLKQINGNIKADDTSDEVLAAIADLQSRLVTLESVALYQEIHSEDDLARLPDTPDFNPNVSYYLRRPDDNNKVSVYIYDTGISNFVCINDTDELTIRAIVTENIGDIIITELDKRVPAAVSAAIDDAFKSALLYGGDAFGNW
jgi:hypothetical protein